MSIWLYKHSHPNPIEPEVDRRTCLFCQTELDLFEERFEFDEYRGALRACSTCGWWCKHTRRAATIRDEDGRRYYSMDGACAQLRTLSLSDISTPAEQVRQYLLAKYDARFDVHPKTFEDVVAGVFRDLGYDAEATAYQGDGGIDVILRTPGNETVGVQAKRYKNAIQVEQIRALAGALLLNDHPRGIFVTTSSYQSGAHSAARGFGARGLPIELIDAERFYDALKLSQRPVYTDFDDWHDEIDDIEEHPIYVDEGPF